MYTIKFSYIMSNNGTFNSEMPTRKDSTNNIQHIYVLNLDKQYVRNMTLYVNVQYMKYRVVELFKEIVHTDI